MRICLISTVFPPDLGWDGSALRCYELCRGLRQLGHDIEVIALTDSYDGANLQDGMVVHRIKAGDTGNGASIICATTPRSRYALGVSSSLWRKFFELHAERPFDVVEAPVSLGAAVAPALTGVAPLVARIERLLPAPMARGLSYAGEAPFGFDERLQDVLEQTALDMCEAIVAPSGAAAAVLQAHCDPVRTHVVREPVDTGAFTREGETALPAEGGPVVLIRGLLSEESQRAFLSSVMSGVVAVLPDTRFLVVPEDVASPASPEGEKELARALRSAVSDSLNVFVRTRPAHPLRPALLRTAEVCLVTPGGDNRPYCWLEPMASGTPVVAVSDPLLGEFVEHLRTGVVVDGGEPAASSRAVVDLLKSGQARDSLRAPARAFVAGEFDRSRVVSQMVSIYEQAALSWRNPKRSRDRALSSLRFVDALRGLSEPYNKMLYDMLFVHSLRFRVGHWLGKVFRGGGRTGSRSERQ